MPKYPDMPDAVRYEKYVDAYILRQQGMTYERIGQALGGLHGAHARQLVITADGYVKAAERGDDASWVLEQDARLRQDRRKLAKQERTRFYRSLDRGRLIRQMIREKGHDVEPRPFEYRLYRR